MNRNLRNKILVSLIFSLLAFINPKSFAQTSDNHVIKYYWPKDPGAKYYIGSYIKNGKLRHFKVPFNYVYTPYKVKFHMLRGISSRKTVSRHYFTPGIKGIWVNKVKELKKENGTSNKSSSLTFLSYYEDTKLQEDLNLKVINKKRENSYSAGKYGLNVGTSLASVGFKSSTGDYSFSSSSTANTVELGGFADIYKGQKFLFGLFVDTEFYSFKVSNVYEETSKLNYYDLKLGLSHKIDVDSFINDLELRASFASLKSPSMEYVDIDILDNVVPGFKNFDTTFLALSLSADRDFSFGSILTEIEVIPYYFSGSGLSYSLDVRYSKNIVKEIIYGYSSFNYSSSNVTFENSCSSSFVCEDQSNSEISKVSLMIGLGMVSKKEFF